MNDVAQSMSRHIAELEVENAALNVRQAELEATLTDLASPDFMVKYRKLERDAARLAEAERLLRKWHGSGHYDCEDGWYSCPMHPDYAGHDDPNHCSCGHKEIAAFLGATDSANEVQK